MRQAKRLGLPGLIAMLVVAGGLLFGGVNVPNASAQVPTPITFGTGTKTCQQPFTGGQTNNAGTPLVTDCTVTVPFTIPVGVTPTSPFTFTDILLDPNACFQPLTSTINLGGTQGFTACTGGTTTVTATIVPGTTTSTLGCPAGASATVSTTGAVTVSCSLPPIVVIGPTNLCEEVDISFSGLVGTSTTPVFFAGKTQVCPPTPIIPPTTVNPLTNVTVTKSCTPSFAGASPTATKVTDCTLVFTPATGVQFNNGTTLEFDTITGGNAVFSTAAVGGGGTTTTGCENGVGGGGVLSNANQTFTCVVGPIIVSGSTTLCETVQIRDAFGNSSAKLNVCPTGTTPTPTSGLSFTAVKNCPNPGAPAVFTPSTITAGGTAVTDCTLVFTATSGQSFPSDAFVADEVLTTGNAGFSSTACSTPLAGGNCVELIGTATAGFCQNTPSTGVNTGFTITCTLPPIVVSVIPSQICDTVELGSPTLGNSSKVSICTTAAPTPTPTPVAESAFQPTGEQKTCTNTTSGAGLSQTLGGTTQALAVSGPGTSFTIPLFGPASTCAVVLTKGVTSSGAPNPCSAANPCADGNVVITLTTPGSGALISCGSTTAPSGQSLPAVSGGGGSCQIQSQGTQLNIGCGVTANTPQASTTASNTCTGVLFDIQSILAACVNTPSFCIGNPAATQNLNQGFTATVTIQFLATPANGGTVGGIQLGTNTFSFAGPGIGTLLVAASPQIIPSNGTLASVVSATFACTTGFTSVSGFPLSTTTTSNFSINASGQLVAASPGCGAGLPGTFTFATPGPVIFDNGRSTESVTCGPTANLNVFGTGPSLFPGIGSTFPLAFTCTGAAVLAIGAGVAGDAPINVTYGSAVGGLQAVGSTLITVSPSGIPRISVACNPSVISAGNTGSLCTATVTDINGVPLSGITGATVTFTTSDPANTTILPCTIGTPGAINITTSPAVIPLITPQTPCVTPSTVIPGQVNTFVNGQATALLVASATAHPEVVTVTASLGVLIPPEFACLVAPYVSSPFGTVPNTAGYYTPTTGTAIAGCGAATPIGTTGLATALNVAGAGLTGIVTLPNTTSASTTVTISGAAAIQVAGATSVSPIVLSRGCNNVIITSPVGTPVANIAALVTPQNAVVSIWRFNNGTKLFNAGFFSDPNAPTDFTLTGSLSTTTAPNGASTVIGAPNYVSAYGPTLSSLPTTSVSTITESYYVCVNQQATMISG